jgi:Domain of unknown function (DUF4234)
MSNPQDPSWKNIQVDNPPPPTGGYGYGGYGYEPPAASAMLAPMTDGSFPISRSEAVRGIAACVLLTLFTCGIYGMYWQYKQFQTINAWLGREEHNFLTYFLLSLITCGLYSIYYEYRFAQTVQDVQRSRGMVVNENLPLIAVLMAFFGFYFVTWAIEQQEINAWYGER